MRNYKPYDAAVVASSYQQADPREVTVKVANIHREWPHGMVTVGFGEATVTMKPNQVRRLVMLLEKAIRKAEAKC